MSKERAEKKLLSRKELHGIAVEHGISFLSATEEDVKRFLSQRAAYKKKTAEKLKDGREEKVRLKESRERDALCVRIRSYLAGNDIKLVSVGIGLPSHRWRTSYSYLDVGIVIRGSKDILRACELALKDFDFSISSRTIPIYFEESMLHDDDYI